MKSNDMILALDYVKRTQLLLCAKGCIALGQVESIADNTQSMKPYMFAERSEYSSSHDEGALSLGYEWN
jgi:hypothetical protein